ncbi:hypothetical protein C8J56DRAFT_1053543 [Mycena floridula]|nr:hypothetical protein C8J56DRAFT_1053543 [Mycena floridula]
MTSQIVVQASSDDVFRIETNGNEIGFVIRRPGGFAIELRRLGNIQVLAGMSKKMVYWGQTEHVEMGSAVNELLKGNRRAFTLDGSTYNWSVQASVVHLVRSEGPPEAVIIRGQGFTSAVNDDEGLVHWTCVVAAAVLEASGWRGL